MSIHRPSLAPLALPLLALGLFLPTASAQPAQASAPATASRPSDELSVLTWNIWHGGREDGDVAGPERVGAILSGCGADLIALQETYGSGEILAELTGFHFHERGTNVSILSRFPVVEDISVHEPFQCVGALVERPSGERVAFYSIWLPYSAEIWEVGTRDVNDRDAMIAACEASAESLTKMHAAIEERVKRIDGDVPIVIAGDFNSMSHLDYGEVGLDQYGVSIPWATGRLLSEARFLDAYREANPAIDRRADATWTPRFPRQSQDRIDFVYYRAPKWRVLGSSVLRRPRSGLETDWPSDHAAVLATFGPQRPAPKEIRALSYNIKHGTGMDGQRDLARAGAVIETLTPDFVALQEVDLAAKRSGFKNQVRALGARLDMHPAFGGFMDFQGGRYGMATLSAHPITRVESLRLPDGNEPRVALVVEAELPGGQRVLVVNVHFDWVRDDAFRFAQAETVRDFLADAELPWLLLGDFNDSPDTRTLALFRAVGDELAKPDGASATFPSDKPTKEIDFAFRSRDAFWGTGHAVVVDEPVASDHSPVLARIQLGR